MNDYYNNILNILATIPNGRTIGSSILFLIIVYIANRILVSNILKKKIDRNQKVQLTKNINNYSKYLALLVLFLIWFSKLHGVFVSLLAVAAAIVLATKELIMCFTGGSLFKTSNIFKLGDRIEINNIRGFVLERGLFATKVLEIGPEKNSQQTTGNVISFPNSLIFSNVLKNESYFKGYSIKSYFFKVEDRKNIDEVEKFLFTEGTEIAQEYLSEAKESISHFCEKEGLVIPAIDPRTKLIIEDNNDTKILLRIPVRNDKIGDVEQVLNRKYIEYLNRL